MTIFLNGRQKRVRRPQLIDGMLVDEFIARNADPLWLHQNEMWDLISAAADEETAEDVGNYRHSRDSKSSVMEQTTMTETPESQIKDAHAQGFDEVPF